MSNKQLHKTLLIKDGSMDGNKMSGDAAGIGNLDCYADVIFPGFFGADCLASFLASGFVADNHDWTKQLAMPTSAEERGTALYTEAEFHSTQDAQDAKTKVQERMDRGLSVGLSIGFDMEASGYKVFKSGTDLLAYAKANNYDLSLFDVAGITAWKGRCQALLKCHELFEYSLATVPANRAAVAAAIKTAQQKADQDGAGQGGKFEIVTLSAGGVRVKGEYLGEDIEAELTMSALDRLMTRLFYRAIYQNIIGTWDYDYDADECLQSRPPLDEALVAIAGAIDEFKDIALRVVEAIMSGAEGAESAEDAAKAIQALYGDPLAKTFGGEAHAASSLEEQLGAALSVVKSAVERGQAINGLRLKDGRVLSEANRQKLTEHKDALESGIAMLDELLAASDPKSQQGNTQQGNNQSLQTSAAGAHLAAKVGALRHELRARRHPAALEKDAPAP